MNGRTYRYFKGDPLYGFGFGLSYSKFQYSGLHSKRTAQGAQVVVKVKNESARDGDEVVQLYVDGTGDTIRQLRGFQRVHLKAGETREVTFAVESTRGPLKFSVGSGQPVGSIPHVSGTL